MQTARAPDGLVVHYTRTPATGGGPPLLLLQGLGAGGAAWAANVAQLSRTRTCVVPDQRGTGRTGAPDGPYTTAELAADAAAVLDAEGPADVVGLSMGGAVAQELALARPDLVRSLVLCGAFLRSDARARALTLAWKEAYPLLPPALFARLSYAWLFSPKFFERPANVDTAVKFALRDRPQPAGFAGQCDAVLAHDTTSRAGGLRARTLVLHGTHDALAPVEGARALAAAIPGARLALVEGGYHALNLERQAEFARAVLEFAG